MSRKGSAEEAFVEQYGVGHATLLPCFEIGVRHDGGDAETGFGLDFGGGLAWSDPGTGVRAEVSGRGLLTDESAGLRERGIAGSFGWDPTSGSDRGPSLTLSQTLGLSAQGGAPGRPWACMWTLSGVSGAMRPVAADGARFRRRDPARRVLSRSAAHGAPEMFNTDQGTLTRKRI